MNWPARQQQLDQGLLAVRELWHPQPFRELQPAWCKRWPALDRHLLTLSEDESSWFNDNSEAALGLLSDFLPSLADIARMARLPQRASQPLARRRSFWDWEIPGRKREQIEAFAAVARGGAYPVLDWCGGKGHLGRLLALDWQVPVHSLDVDAGLCAAGAVLARRAVVDQQFIHADALRVEGWPQFGQQVVALHACGELHRHLVRQGVARGVAALDLAPCCYHRGVETNYQPLSGPLELTLTRDDTRLAVTETVTANGRETRLRDQALAWKLGFDAYRRQSGDGDYRNFKSVPDRWLRASFAEFMQAMTCRENLPPASARVCVEFEAAGWQRRHAVMRYSIVRHAFRRAIEVWLALDLAVYLGNAGYAVDLGSFCPRQLTPRNLLLSAHLS